MAFIGLKVPQDKAGALASIPVPSGKPLAPEEMHVTLLYLGKDVPLMQSLGSVLACASVAQKWKPFTVHAALLMNFPENPEDGTPVIVRVVSEELMAFREELRKAVDKMGVPYSNKYPEYKPHVTLAYAGAGARVGPEKIVPVSWEVSSLCVWSGQEMDDDVTSVVYLRG